MATPRPALALLTAWLLAAALAPAAVGQEIGAVEEVRFSAYGTPPQEGRRPLTVRTGVVADELVETVPGGALHIRFRDDTALRLGSDSRATLDRFVYDPGARRGEATIELIEGIFRLQTGLMNKEGYLVVTPVALIGVRGTDFIAWILAGRLVLAVLEGEIVVTPLLAGAVSTVLGAGETAAVEADGGVRTGVPAPPTDPGLQDRPAPAGPAPGPAQPGRDDFFGPERGGNGPGNGGEGRQ